nr:hypothetical protein [uncultured Mediterranean phage uvMED]
MSASLQITRDLIRNFYSAYRPILFQVEDLDGTAAYLSAELQRESSPGSNLYVSTGIICHAYEDLEEADHYTFNIMGFVRELLTTGTWSKFSQMVTSGFFETGTRFRLSAYANRYGSSPNVPLITDINDTVISLGFYGLGTNTDITQHLTKDNIFPFVNHISVDRLVLGDNQSQGGADISLRFSQNSPNYNSPSIFVNDSFRSHRASKSYTINRKDSRNDAIYQPVSIDKTWAEFWLSIYYFDLNESLVGSDTIFVSSQTSLQKIPAHPEKLYDYIQSHGGSNANLIIDANNDLISSGVAIAPFVKQLNNPTVKFLAYPKNIISAQNYQVDVQYIDWSDKADNGKCNRTKFCFRTSSGSYDWINIYGTEKKETSFEQTIYDKLPSTGLLDGSQHARKTLYNKREDTFTVTSQPMPKDVALHCEELLNSSLVWIEKESKYPHMTGLSINDGKLIPVLIVPNSFSIYTTESNLSFVEFSYILSERLTTQKG